MTGARSIGERLRHNRHSPRLCTSCGSPMACQQDTCWNCAAPWSQEPDAPRARLRLVGSSPAPAPAPSASTAQRLAALREQARA